MDRAGSSRERREPPGSGSIRRDNKEPDKETRKRKASRSRSGSKERSSTLDDPRGGDLRQGDARMSDVRPFVDGRRDRDERDWSDRRGDRGGGGGRGDAPWGGRGDSPWGGRGGRGGYHRDGPPHGRGPYDFHGRGRGGPREGYREMQQQQMGRSDHHPFSPMDDDRQRGQGGGYRDEIRAIDEANRRSKKGTAPRLSPYPELHPKFQPCDLV